MNSLDSKENNLQGNSNFDRLLFIYIYKTEKNVFFLKQIQQNYKHGRL